MRYRRCMDEPFLLRRIQFHVDLLQKRNEISRFGCSKIQQKKIRQDIEAKIFITDELCRRKPRILFSFHRNYPYADSKSCTKLNKRQKISLVVRSKRKCHRSYLSFGCIIEIQRGCVEPLGETKR